MNPKWYKIPIDSEIIKKWKSYNNTQSINLNNKDKDIQESTQDSNTRSNDDINLPEDGTDTVTVNEQSINSNNADLLESAQDSNSRSIDKSGMVQDSELPKINNLNTETNTNLDGKENGNIQPEDSNKTDAITVNDQNINANNKDTDIQHSNETLIDEYETV